MLVAIAALAGCNAAGGVVEPSPTAVEVGWVCEALGLAARTPSDLAALVEAARAGAVEDTASKAAQALDTADAINLGATYTAPTPEGKRLAFAMSAIAAWQSQGGSFFSARDSDPSQHDVDEFVAKLPALDPAMGQLRVAAGAAGFGSCVET